jgi:uncharacterized membrane protein
MESGSSWVQWFDVVFRWLHVIAGVMWIGHLWFFNFVNAQLAKTYDADSKKKVVPELMPRALYFFRWGAAWTWGTGLLLLLVLYYHGGLLLSDNQSMGPAGGLGLGLVLLSFFVYDLLWKSLGKNETVAAAISFVLLVGVMFVFQRVMSGRAMFIHIGGLMGTIMAMNVWMRIWPSQRKIIGGIKGTSPAADPAVVALAGLRSKHNTYLSIPLLFTMVSNHYPQIYGHDHAWIILAVIVGLGWALAKRLYGLSANASVAKI